jgi:protein tyrosine phosphatase (PTP) superfamily phosphohydrolase (DUF442 family)
MMPHAGRGTRVRVGRRWFPRTGLDMPAGWVQFGRVAVRGIVLGLVTAVAVEARSVFLGRNWHVVLRGIGYRSAQLSARDLDAAVRLHGIRTVVNLRGTCPTIDWYLAESRATWDADLAQEDVTLSALRLPAPDEVRRLVDVLDHAEPPLLLHCRQGVDRTGLASAVLLLLKTNATPAEARRQLGPRYGHVPIGPTRNMLRFFDLYEDWLRREGRSHAPDALREWADRGYCPGRARGRLELLAGSGPPAVRVRAVNTSPEPWPLCPGTETGVHVRFLVFDANWRTVQMGRAGQFESIVPPGGTVDLTLAVTPPRAGPYTVIAELMDGNRCSFTQLGGQPLELPIVVGNSEG